MMLLSFRSGRGALLSAVAGAALALTAACEASAAPKVHTIVVGEMNYSPAVKKLRAGDSILWVNKGVLRHTATARDKSFNVDLPPRTSRKLVITSPGEVPYYCVYHPTMKGIVSVGRR